ncbi:HAMP domain-containing sensor histidine kinase [Clostridium aestuarii]|uniref:histidine kinase n=1 Tax=Clostridium aestuarii TaxID=338193 RepID=A0ABT4CV28_9CLOT|nr:HAMP domain-containing sensor histidine kinase [Clostridium aestuarii]MCY6482837.1 HAMP domain-containing sensor histidine kinase [Clostridium aestuarii]
MWLKKHTLMQKKKLSNLLLRNYLLLYILVPLILIVVTFIGLFITSLFLEDIEDDIIFPTANEIMQDDYKKINSSAILKANGWIEIIDANYTVIFTKGNPQYKINSYTKEQYYKMLLQNSYDYDNLAANEKFNKNYDYSFAYNKNQDFILAIVVPIMSYPNIHFKSNKVTPKRVLFFFAIFYIISLVLGTALYAKLTSKTFVTPLKILMKGVKSITNGDYSTRITLKSKNEFGSLKDAFNLMAQKIEEERKLKEKSEETRRKLIMDISHDLKNPLASIIGYSDLLIKNPDVSEKERIKYLKVLENNSIRANNLINDLFELSKLESANFKLQCETKDICEFLRELIAGYIPQMEEKSINYNFDIPEKSILLCFDSKNMDRAISNIILNSIKYTSTGTNLYLSLKEGLGSIVIVIQDDGIGIPKKLSKEIFAPFVRVDSSRNSKSGGTGIGLAITKTIIKKHGGTIKLNTDINKGCKFTITLKI